MCKDLAMGQLAVFEFDLGGQTLAAFPPINNGAEKQFERRLKAKIKNTTFGKTKVNPFPMCLWRPAGKRKSIENFRKHSGA